MLQESDSGGSAYEILSVASVYNGKTNRDNNDS